MRRSSIICDWCGAEITEHLVKYGRHPLIGHATWEGMRYDWDFCSDDCLAGWKEHGCVPRRVVEARGDTNE